jgi:hypothetical protein
VLFPQADELLFLAHAQLRDGALELVRYADYDFAEAIILGLWGTTSLFLSHIVIRVPLSELIFVKKLEATSFAFWTFRTGHFVLRVHAERVAQMRSLFTTQSDAAVAELSNDSFLFRIPDLQTALARAVAGKLSVDDLLLAMNGLSGRVFADIHHFPYFPLTLRAKEYSPKFPTKQETLAVLRKLAPFSYYATTISAIPGADDDSDGSPSSGSPTVLEKTETAIEDSALTVRGFRQRSRSESVRPIRQAFSLERLNMILPAFDGDDVKDPPNDCPAVCYYWPELFAHAKEPGIAIIARRRALLEQNETAPDVREWAKYHFKYDRSIRRVTDIAEPVAKYRHIGSYTSCHVHQVLNIQCGRKHTVAFVDDAVVRLRRTTAPICNGFVAVIEDQSLSLAIIEIPSMRVHSRMTKPVFAYASGLAVTANGLFMAVDFSFALTRCYQIRYSQRRPSEFVHISDFSWTARPTSFPNGVHCLVASAVGDKVVVWEMFGGRIHRVLKVPGEVKKIAQDEEYGVWVVAADGLFMYGINGQLLAQSRIDREITTLCAMQLHRARTERTLICGTAAGELFLAHPLFASGFIDFVKLPSPHESAIERIVVCSTGKAFLSVDRNELCCC